MSTDTFVITPFEKLKITTMTLVIGLTSCIDMSAAFHLLPVTRIDIPQARGVRKCKLPHCDIPGAIVSIRHRGSVRGVIRNLSKPFKNAVTIDIFTSRKNVSVKLSPYTIQMCGASCMEDGDEASAALLKHLHDIQDLLDTMQAHPQRTMQLISWFKEQSRGTLVDVDYYVRVPAGHLTLVVKKQQKANLIELPKIGAYKTIENNVNEQELTAIDPQNLSKFDHDVLSFCASLSADFVHHSDMCRKLDYLLRKEGDDYQVPFVIERPLAVKGIDSAMVNYNYSLGFQVNRLKLNQYIDGMYDFISRYNNAMINCVVIELVYTPPSSSAIKRRKNKIPHHTFLVYRSGSVTQTGPGGDLMRDAYYLFMNTIAEIKDAIMYVPGTVDTPVPVASGPPRTAFFQHPLDKLEEIYGEHTEDAIKTIIEDYLSEST
jgi:hypothetical protein